jgi:hypothetical protein
MSTPRLCCLLGVVGQVRGGDGYAWGRSGVWPCILTSAHALFVVEGAASLLVTIVETLLGDE